MQKPKTTKKNINKLKVKLAKSLAYCILVVLASYGLINALETLNEVAKAGITVTFILGLVHIISQDNE